jgi:hypothetical protein
MPQLENSGPFLEAAALSAKLREAPRPERPLKIVIAGAGALIKHFFCSNPHAWLSLKVLTLDALLVVTL